MLSLLLIAFSSYS